MNENERLAAYLDGDELSPSERAELEDELAQRPELRDRLASLREVDEALRSLPPPVPPEGFDERLDAAVDEALEHHLGDEFAARRPRVPRWALAAAAGLLLVLGGAGVAVNLLGPSADEPTVTDAPAEGDRGIHVTVSDRNYDAEEARGLLDDDRFEARAGSERLRGEAEPHPAPPAAGQGAAEDRAEEAPAGGPEAAERCLPRLLDEAPDRLVPAFAEVARFRGEPAIVYGLLAPDDGAPDRREIWILARDTCEVRLFAPD